MNYSYQYYALIFKALSDETRFKIVNMLSENELCACDILEEVNITQPTLSYHMKILVDCDLVHVRKDGSWMRYILNKEKVVDLMYILKEVNKPKINLYNKKNNCQ